MTDDPNAPAPAKNVELKARLALLDAAEQVARSIMTGRLDDEHQIDTYFHCGHGRLKMREINGERAQLISYQRPDQTSAKTSRYRIAEVPNPDVLKAVLADSLGVRVVVDKHRQIFLRDNVRIHLDRVEGLGEFLEFEAVLTPKTTDQPGKNQVAELQQRFEITDEQLITGSYADMLEKT